MNSIHVPRVDARYWLAITMAVSRGTFASAMAYWATVGLARTAGTAMGHWLAENHLLNLGLPLATLLPGITFVLVAAWPRREPAGAPAIG